MTRKPPKTLEQMAAEASGGQPMHLAGKPAHICPYCGAAMFKDGTNRTDKVIVRYVECRNRNCKRRFLTSQPPERIVREISEDDSAGGKPALTLVRESA